MIQAAPNALSISAASAALHSRSGLPAPKPSGSRSLPLLTRLGSNLLELEVRSNLSKPELLECHRCEGTPISGECSWKPASV